MEEKMNIIQVRNTLGTLVDDVQYQNKKYIIVRYGKPAVAIVPLHVYENWKSSRERLFGLSKQMQESGGSNDPDEIMDLVLEVQQSVRKSAAEEQQTR